MRLRDIILRTLTAVAVMSIVPEVPAQQKAAESKKAAEARKPDAKATTAAEAIAAYDTILQKYLRDGHFAYADLKKNEADLALLKKFMDWQAKADVKSMAREDQIAFYINAYNSACIQAVLDHYPVHSPNDIPGFFDKLKFTVAGESLTISGIEYDRLIANYKDMRAHFAVVCADRGCQPLKPGAWKGATLDKDLDVAAKQFVSGKKYFFVDKEKGEVNISKIFEWYGEKFTQDPERPAAKPELYLLPYVDGDAKAMLESGDYKLKIIEWDWILNETLKK
jgi:hypothetical protein